MDHCEVCGNAYEHLFEVKFKDTGTRHWFDCFECATYKLAPQCNHCGVRILGHGVQAGALLFCGAHCARSEGYRDIVDHSESIMTQ